MSNEDGKYGETDHNNTPTSWFDDSLSLAYLFPTSNDQLPIPGQGGFSPTPLGSTPWDNSVRPMWPTNYAATFATSNPIAHAQSSSVSLHDAVLLSTRRPGRSSIRHGQRTTDTTYPTIAASNQLTTTFSQNTMQVSTPGIQPNILDHRPAILTSPQGANDAWVPAEHGTSQPRPRTPGLSRSLSRRTSSRRRGPLNETSRTKDTGLRDSRACWRCRRYKKACDDDLICKSCITGGFRVWPSQVGCRRDSLESFTIAILPSNLEQILTPTISTISNRTRSQSWRSYVRRNAGQLSHVPKPSFGKGPRQIRDIKLQARATGMYGDEIDGLLDIVEAFQSHQAAKNPLLEAACTALALSCDFYHLFVAPPSPHSLDGKGEPQDAQREVPGNHHFSLMVSKLRNSFSKSFRLFVTHCLSRDRADWCPAILAMSLLATSICVFLDAAFAVPEPARSQVWCPNIYTAHAQIRMSMSGIVLDLLRARADDDSLEGPRPLMMDCWTITTTTTKATHPLPSSVDVVKGSSGMMGTMSGTSGSVPDLALSAAQHSTRNPVGMALVNNNTDAFDGFADLQSWMRKHMAKLDQGRQYFANGPYSQPDLAPIANLSTLLGV